jgi:hypothetical protein
VYTFGLGNDCDVDMVQKSAKNGRGSCSIVRDDETNLKALVIAALKHASDLSLQNCNL